VIIVLTAAVAVAVAGALFTGVGKPGSGGRLKRRFGPEYDRVLARHNGDTKAAERELAGRVRAYGSFTPQPLPPQVREQYLSRWTAAQERFVESPRLALAEVYQLLGGLAQARGFPGPERHGEHTDALSVHHPHHIDGYRRVHAAATAPGTAATADSSPAAGAPGASGPPGAGGPPGAEAAGGTENMRVVMLQAREFFDALATEQPEPKPGRTGRRARWTGRTPQTARPLTHDGTARGLFAARRSTKGREAS
jgi:hypothetical protein